MAIEAQKINEELAKGTKIETDIKKEIKRANKYLLKSEGECPEWLDDFFMSNKNKLVETICRAISSPDGISSLSGYNEGYFNEIIQNANDLHCGEDIDIRVKKDGCMYSVSCRYADKGFELSNIYAFLNREMSDKTSENGQTGKFGVGIKSFFKFVTFLAVDSNIKFDFKLQGKPDDVQVSGEVELNREWDKKTTELLFEYDSNQSGAFNTEKLTNLIDYLSGNSLQNGNKFFITDKDNELLFDLRSLIFMRINSWKGKKNAISRLSFTGECHKVELLCEDAIEPETLTIDEETWNLFDMKLIISVDEENSFEQEYVVFLNKEMAFGFPADDSLEERNRVYSTYYLKTVAQEQIRPLSMLVNSNYSNIHRNDVGDSEESIQKVYKTIKDKMQRLYICMCSNEMASSKYRYKVSDVFHSILVRYMDADTSKYEESPLKCDDLSNCFLPKQIHGDKKYIVVHESEEKYERATHLERDIVGELKKAYFDFVEEDNVLDYQSMIESEDCITGVKRLYTRLNEGFREQTPLPKENIEKISEIVNYFDKVQEFLAFIICGERERTIVTDAEIDRWLIELEAKVGDGFNPQIFLKLVGRYEINEAIDFDGTVISSNLSFKDYLFNGVFGEKKGILAEYQNKQFGEKYSGLKKELLAKRYVDLGNKEDQYVIRCMEPTGRSRNRWTVKFDYYCLSACQINSQPLSEPELFLEKLATDTWLKYMLHIEQSMWGGSQCEPIRLFEKKAREMRYRDKLFEHYGTIEQQIIDISCIRQIELPSFFRFITAIKYKKILNETCSKLEGQIHLTCFQEEITTQNIADDLLPLMIESQDGEKKADLLDEFKPDNVKIAHVLESTNNEAQKENREFIRKLTGYNIHLYHFESKTRRKVVAYCGRGKIAIRTDASRSFRDIAKYMSTEKDVYIFYDNFANDSDKAIALVLDEIGIPKETLELFEGYIHNGNNTKTMNYLSRRRNLAKLVNVKRKFVLDWCEIKSNEVTAIHDNEILYRLLTARGSYDIFCPICADIPLETFDYGEDTKKKHSRKIIILENDNSDTREEIPYIITVACSYCFERLRNTLSKSEFDGTYLTLTTQIAHGQHEKTKSKRKIELSPINVELMKKFKMK